LYSTVYYPQTDRQSERANQSVEIALCYFSATLLSPEDWEPALLYIQFYLNNLIVASTLRSPNEALYSFSPNDSICLLGDPPAEIAPLLPSRVELNDAIDIAAIYSSMLATRFIYSYIRVTICQVNLITSLDCNSQDLLKSLSVSDD
jgi:hypothetical protein